MRWVAGVMLAALAAGSAAAQDRAGGARGRATVLMSENPAGRAFQESAGYADAVVIDGTAYLSGVVVGFGGGTDTLEAAYERVFARLSRTLARAGATWDDVVDMTSYHTDLTTQLGPMTKVKARYVKPPFPAWTAIGVSRLVPDAGVTEIKIVARMRGRR